MNHVELFLALNAASGQVSSQVWMTLSLLGTGWAAFALAFPTIVMAPRTFCAVVISTPIAGMVSTILKRFIDAPRPPAVLEPETFILLGPAVKAHSMPSGHTITAFAVVTAIYASAPKRHRLALAPLFLLALAIGFARIAIGVHWVEDVAAGAAIGVAAGLLGARIAKRLPASTLLPSSWWLRGLSLWGLPCVAMLSFKSLEPIPNMPVQITLAGLAAATLAVFWAHSLRPAKAL